MKCVIPGINVKVVARAVHSLCRIGDELYVEPESSKLSLRAVSSSKSAYASFTFFDSFFSYYNYQQPNSQEEDVTCKISMKSCLSVFRSPGHMDKQVETCQIKLEPGADKLVFEFQYHHGIVKTHYLPIIECETLEAVYSKDTVPNRLVAQPKLFTFSLTNFQLNTPELTWVISAEKMLVRNFAEDETEMTKGVRTELCLGPREFDQYNIEMDTSITFCLKEFRALLQFAEAVSLPIVANFETGGNSSTVYQHNVTGKSSVKKKSSVRKKVPPLNSSTNTSIPGPSVTTNSFQNNCIIESATESLPTLRILELRPEENDARGNSEEDEEDTLPQTPPPVKKVRYIFKRCFQNTFNSQMLADLDEVLAGDSDEEKRT
ncbi:Cell cycle checkpoint control protein RAD9A [Blattella germanica]|nr:Cell cycle checkpoint control protein RAD9A [Blattella germanica]